MALITRLLNIASKKYPEVQAHNHPWIARPTTVGLIVTCVA